MVDSIVEKVVVFETECNGKRAFLLVTQSMLKDDKILQPNRKVVKPNGKQNYDRRFRALESQIMKLKSLLLLNEGKNKHTNKKKDEQEWARCDSDTRSPPCQGDVITS
jgi:hypothetical protein